jgi:SSS family solute:Na+ symporter/sodium/proline symporter
MAIAFFVPTMLLLLGDANMYQRIFSARDASTARKAVFFWVIGVVILEAGISLFGLTGSVAASQGLITDLGAAGVAETETVIPTVALQALPGVLGMLVVATMMAMIVSTADSFLLVPATNLTRDVFQRYLAKTASERSIVLTGRLLVLALGIIAYLLVGRFPTILEAAYTAYLIYGTAITPALLAAFLWKRATMQGAVASIIMGAGITLIWTFVLPEWDAIGFSSWSPFLREVTYPAVALSVAALVIVSLVTPAPGRAVWSQFFNES